MKCINYGHFPNMDPLKLMNAVYPEHKLYDSLNLSISSKFSRWEEVSNIGSLRYYNSQRIPNKYFDLPKGAKFP